MKRLFNPFQKKSTPEQRRTRFLVGSVVAALFGTAWIVFLVVAIVNELEKLAGGSVAQVVGTFVLFCLIVGMFFVYGWIAHRVLRGIWDD